MLLVWHELTKARHFKIMKDIAFHLPYCVQLQVLQNKSFTDLKAPPLPPPRMAEYKREVKSGLSLIWIFPLAFLA